MNAPTAEQLSGIAKNGTLSKAWDAGVLIRAVQELIEARQLICRFRLTLENLSSGSEELPRWAAREVDDALCGYAADSASPVQSDADSPIQR